MTVRRSDRREGCLFCGVGEGSFASEEHIVPLTAGNAEGSGLVELPLVIPPGTICDKCNGRRLSVRDQAFTDWPPLSAFRVLAQVRNRKGRLRDAVEGTAWKISFHPTDPLEFRLDLDADTGPASGLEDVARALCKIALETRFLEDPDEARDSRWDPVAAAAIGGPLPPGLAMGLRLPPTYGELDLSIDSEVKVDPDSAELRMALRLDLLGLTFLVLLDVPRPPDPRNAWWTPSDDHGLSGPSSMYGSFYGRAEAAKRVGVAAERSTKDSSRLPTADPETSIFLAPSDGSRPDRPNG